MKAFALSVLLLSAVVPALAGTYEDELKLLSSSMGSALQRAGLKTVAIGAIKDVDGKETSLGKLLSEELSVELVNQGNGISMVDRANLNRLMDEYKLTEEGLIDPDNAKKLKLAGIDALIFGTIVPFDKTYRVQLKAVATDSAKVVGASRGSIEETDSLNELMGVTRIASLPAQKETGSGSDAKQAVPRTYDIGDLRFDLKSVAFHKKTGNIRVTYTVTNTGRSRATFAYYLHDLNAPDVDIMYLDYRYRDSKASKNVTIKGQATDDSGREYSILMPADGKTRPNLEPEAPVAFALEYAGRANPDGQIKIPKSVTFWFEYFGSRSAQRFSVVDFPIDKAQ